jgi:ribosome maturation factor RimP
LAHFFYWSITERSWKRLAVACETVMPPHANTSVGRAADVERLIAPAVEAMGYDVVRVLLSSSRRPRLQIMAERKDGAGRAVEDCVAVSRAVEAILDVEDPIGGPYELEVSSPGIDRPLTRLADFERFAGFDAKLETSLSLQGQRRWKGRLLGLEGDTVRLQTETGEVALPFAEITRAKLLLTDELMAAAERARPLSNEGTE